MRAQDENRTGGERRRFDLNSISAIEVNRRWVKERRSYVVDEDEIYGAETTIHDDLWVLSQSALRW